MKGTEHSCNTGTGQCLGVKSFSPYISELKEKDPCHPLAHRGSSTVGEGHQEHHRGPGTMCLQHCSWGQLLKGKILLQEKERTSGYTLAGLHFRGSSFSNPQIIHTLALPQHPDVNIEATHCPSGTRTQRVLLGIEEEPEPEPQREC